MRIGTSLADKIGFIVFISLAVVLAAVLALKFGSDTTESAQELSIAEPAAEEPVPTTQPVEFPTATATPTAIPTAIPTATALPTVAPTSTPTAVVAASTSSGNTASNTATQSAAAQPATQATAVPNPQPATTAVPNPQPVQATAVPNPQPATTAVPNPQPATTAVPNPQPVQSAPVTVPVAAPVGGTYTRTLTATVPNPTLYRTPGGQPFTPTFNGTALPATNPTYYGNALVYRVLAGEPGDGWAQVYVPARPNGTTAWVQTNQFSWGQSNRKLVISVSARTVTVYEGSNVLLTTNAVLGKSSSPTPIANGWVEEFVSPPSSAYGPIVISLGIFSDALNSFGSGVPKVALHGTNNPGLIGQYASNGCIRVENSQASAIYNLLPVGSKVEIVP